MALVNSENKGREGDFMIFLVLIPIVLAAGFGLFFAQKREKQLRKEEAEEFQARLQETKKETQPLPRSGAAVARPAQPEKSKTLQKEHFYVAGVYHHKTALKALAKANPDWRKSGKTLVAEGKAGEEIYHYLYADRPVKLVFEPNNAYDPHAIKVLVAGEHIGYVPEDENLHIGDILRRHDVKYLYARFHGGEVKLVSENGDTVTGENQVGARIFIGYLK